MIDSNDKAMLSLCEFIVESHKHYNSIYWKKYAKRGRIYGFHLSSYLDLKEFDKKPEDTDSEDESEKNEENNNNDKNEKKKKADNDTDSESYFSDSDAEDEDNEKEIVTKKPNNKRNFLPNHLLNHGMSLKTNNDSDENEVPIFEEEDT